MTGARSKVASYVLGDQLEPFLTDYSAGMKWVDLVERYKPHGHHSLYGVARRHNAIRPHIAGEFDISPELRAAIMVDYAGAIPVADIATKYGRSRQALWHRVFRHATPDAHQARKEAVSAARRREAS